MSRWTRSFAPAVLALCLSALATGCATRSQDISAMSLRSNIRPPPTTSAANEPSPGTPTGSTLPTAPPDTVGPKKVTLDRIKAIADASSPTSWFSLVWTIDFGSDDTADVVIAPGSAMTKSRAVEICESLRSGLHDVPGLSVSVTWGRDGNTVRSILGSPCQELTTPPRLPEGDRRE